MISQDILKINLVFQVQMPHLEALVAILISLLFHLRKKLVQDFLMLLQTDLTETG